MTDIVEFLAARLDEDEASARQAVEYGTGRWENTSTGVVDLGLIDPDLGVFGLQTFEDGRVAAHIARHDPARVLAEVAAKRKLLWEIHAITISRPDGAPDEDLLDRPAGRLLRAMASAYADHEDFDPAWRLA